MTKIIGMQSLQKALSGTVGNVARSGEPVVVTNYHRAVAVILPLSEYERLTGQIFVYYISEHGGAGFEPVPTDRPV